MTTPAGIRSLLGISWMWFFVRYSVAVPSFARDVLGGNEQAASLLLVVFSVDCIGLRWCETLSHRHVEIDWYRLVRWG